MTIGQWDHIPPVNHRIGSLTDRKRRGLYPLVVMTFCCAAAAMCWLAPLISLRPAELTAQLQRPLLAEPMTWAWSARLIGTSARVLQVEGADHVLPLLFHTPDESDSPYFDQNLAADEAAAKVGSQAPAAGCSVLGAFQLAGLIPLAARYFAVLSTYSLPVNAPSEMRCPCL